MLIIFVVNEAVYHNVLYFVIQMTFFALNICGAAEIGGRLFGGHVSMDVSDATDSRTVTTV